MLLKPLNFRENSHRLQPGEVGQQPGDLGPQGGQTGTSCFDTPQHIETPTNMVPP